MSKLPSYLHQFFPDQAFDCTAEYTDRRTELEIEYRPAPTLAAIEAALQQPYDISDVHEHDPDDLPRFRDD